MKIFSFIRDLILPCAYPPYLIFFITERCNMVCKHCFLHKNPEAGRQELELNEIEKIAKSMPNLFFLRLTGGEPFLRKDIYEIIELFYRYSNVRRISINTNGILTEEIVETMEKVTTNLKDLTLEIGISIDDLYEKHDTIREYPGAFEKAMDTYDKLIGIRENTGNLRVGFLTTIMNENQDDLEEIFVYLTAKNPDSVGLNMIRGVPGDMNKLNIGADKYDNARHMFNSYNFKNCGKQFYFQKMRMVKTIISQETIVAVQKTGQACFPCLAGDMIAVLYSDGKVAACELRDDVIGNVRNYECNVRNLWKNSKRKNICRTIKKNRCCCTHECFITAGQIFSIAGLLKIFFRSLRRNYNPGKLEKIR
jgi:MoaA/NifB/PqqE/SkfB family radical SAM enzyme